jgi:hypothetical protein
MKSSGQLLSSCYLVHAAWLAFSKRSFGRHRNFERAQAIFAGDSWRAVVQNVMSKISDLRDVRFRKPCQVMVGKHLRAAILGQESRGRLSEASHQN